jgi:hydrogenase maturation factor HypF (carbamoyltransferase family)
MYVSLKLHENVIIISTPKEGDLIVYIPEKDMEEKVKNADDIYIDTDRDVVEDLDDDMIGFYIGEMKQLLKKAQNYYYRLEEKNKILMHDLKDELFPMVVITFYILKQIKMILRSKALGNIANEIENNELNVAWDLFQYLLKKMPSGSELLNKINKDKFMEDYAKVFMLR